MFTGVLMEGSKEIFRESKQRALSQALDSSNEKQIEEREKIIQELKEAEGTSLYDLFTTEEAEMALRFIDLMKKHNMPGSTLLPTAVTETSPAITVTKKILFKTKETFVLEAIESQITTRGYLIGATGIGLPPDGKDRDGVFYNNPGPGVYVCEDGTARQSARLKGEKSFPFALDLGKDIYAWVEGVSTMPNKDAHPSGQPPLDFHTGLIISKPETIQSRFYAMVLERRLGQIIAENNLGPSL